MPTEQSKIRSTVLGLPETQKISRMQLILPAILSRASWADFGAENKKYGSETARDTETGFFFTLPIFSSNVRGFCISLGSNSSI